MADQGQKVPSALGREVQDQRRRARHLGMLSRKRRFRRPMVPLADDLELFAGRIGEVGRHEEAPAVPHLAPLAAVGALDLLVPDLELGALLAGGEVPRGHGEAHRVTPLPDRLRHHRDRVAAHPVPEPPLQPAGLEVATEPDAPAWRGPPGRSHGQRGADREKRKGSCKPLHNPSWIAISRVILSQDGGADTGCEARIRGGVGARTARGECRRRWRRDPTKAGGATARSALLGGLGGVRGGGNRRRGRRGGALGRLAVGDRDRLLLGISRRRGSP